MSAHEDAVKSLVNGGYAQQIAREILAAVVAEDRAESQRRWAAKILEVGTAKGWSTWAAAFMDPDIEFVDTGMPSTETIVAELRRLDRVKILRDAASAINNLPQDYECDPGRGDAANLLRRMADEAERGKDTSGGRQLREGESTAASAASAGDDVAAERNCLAMAVMFALQWKPDAPMGLREGIEEILSSMPTVREKSYRLAVEPLVVARYDVAMEPAPEEGPVFTIGAVAEDGQPVALFFDQGARAKVAGWLGADLIAADQLAHCASFEIPWPGQWRDLLVQRSYAGGDRWMICDREGRSWHREFGFVYERLDLDERTRTDTRFPLAEAWPLAQRIAAGEAPVRAEHGEGEQP